MLESLERHSIYNIDNTHNKHLHSALSCVTQSAVTENTKQMIQYYKNIKHTLCEYKH